MGMGVLERLLLTAYEVEWGWRGSDKGGFGVNLAMAKNEKKYRTGGRVSR